MSEQTHPEVIARVLDHPKVSYRLHRRPGDRPGTLRVIEHQAQYLERRCDYIASDPCARFPSCLCGQQMVEHVLLELQRRSRIDPPAPRRSAHPYSGDPPPRTTPPAPPRKQPAVAMPVPRAMEFTDARGEAWVRYRRIKGM